MFSVLYLHLVICCLVFSSVVDWQGKVIYPDGLGDSISSLGSGFFFKGLQTSFSEPPPVSLPEGCLVPGVLGGQKTSCPLNQTFDFSLTRKTYYIMRVLFLYSSLYANYYYTVSGKWKSVLLSQLHLFWAPDAVLLERLVLYSFQPSWEQIHRTQSMKLCQWPE